MSEAVASVADGQGAAAPAAPAAPTSSSAALAVSAVPPAPTGQQATQAPAPAPAPAAPSWLDGADETTIGYVQNKGWNDPKQVLEGYRNLEKLLGADKAGNAVIIPKADADPKEWGAVFDRLGRPTGPDGYKVEVPPGGDPEIHNASMAKFHELGLTKSQGEQLASWYNGLVQQATQATEAQRQAEFQAQDMALKSEWGGAYTQNLAQAQAGARGLGLDAATIDKMSEALGHKATMSLLQKVGAGMREDSLVTSDSTSGFSNALTPGQAKAQIQALMQDRDFTTKYMSGNADARARMEALHRYAYPEG